MIAITKSMIALSAVIAAGVVAYGAVATSSNEPSAAAQVAQRFPTANETFGVLTVKPTSLTIAVKADREALATGNCERQDWPYIAPSCLVSADGKPVRRVSRVVTIERRTSTNSSELTRMPVTTVANR